MRISRPAAAAMVTLLALLVPNPVAAAICIDVQLRFASSVPSPALVHALRDEASAIWEPYGVLIEWTPGEPPPGCAAVVGSFDVIVAAGDDPGRPQATAVTLGRTQVPPAAVDHVSIHIDRAATEHLLASLRIADLVHSFGALVAAPSDIGRALGRVLAHEIGHVILRAPAHQRRGLMRPTFIATDLFDPQSRSYTLSPGEVARLRQREVELAARLRSSPRPDFAPDAGRPGARPGAGGTP